MNDPKNLFINAVKNYLILYLMQNKFYNRMIIKIIKSLLQYSIVVINVVHELKALFGFFGDIGLDYVFSESTPGKFAQTLLNPWHCLLSLCSYT